MTNLWVASDLHLEFFPPGAWLSLFHTWRMALDAMPLDVRPKVIVLAGDIHYASFVPQVLHDLYDVVGLSIVFVAGNHEFYMAADTVSVTMERLLDAAMRLRQTGRSIYVLYRDVVRIEGVLFIGATLWADGRLGFLPGAGLNDYAFIKEWSREAMMVAHANDLRYLRSILYGLSPDERHRAVVVTHHMPSPKAVAPQYKDAPNGEFASDLNNLILDTTPALWIFGHTHTKTHVAVGSTPLIGHPLGYKRHPSDKIPDCSFVPLLVRDYSAKAHVGAKS